MEVTNALGRRKKAVARVYLTKGEGNVTINKKDYKEFFPTSILQGKEKCWQRYACGIWTVLLPVVYASSL